MMRIWKWTTLHISELIFFVVSTSDLVCWPSAIMLVWLACKPCQAVHHSELETIVFQLLIVVNQPISSCPPLSSAYTSKYREDQWLLSDSRGQISNTSKVLLFCLITRRNNLTFRPPWCDAWQCYTRWKVFFLSGKLFWCLAVGVWVTRRGGVSCSIFVFPGQSLCVLPVCPARPSVSYLGNNAVMLDFSSTLESNTIDPLSHRPRTRPVTQNLSES